MLNLNKYNERKYGSKCDFILHYIHKIELVSKRTCNLEECRDEVHFSAFTTLLAALTDIV